MARNGKGKKYFTFLQSYYYVIVLDGGREENGGDPGNGNHRNGVVCEPRE